MDNLSNSPSAKTQQQKLVFSAAEHQAVLQKHLFKQWTDGHNCDLIISTPSADIPVHSCVMSSFSTKICRQLLMASLSASNEGYCLVEDGLCFTICSSGEKRVAVDVSEDVIQALISFMYTGKMSVPQHQIMVLLNAAELLAVSIVINIIRVFINRNPTAVKSHSQALTQKEDMLSRKEPSPPIRQVQSEDSLSSTALAGASPSTVDDAAEALSLGSVELDVKQEMEQDIEAFLNRSSEVQGGQRTTKTCGGGLSADDENDVTASGGGDVLNTGQLSVKIEEEVWEDFPLHFEKLISESRSSQPSNIDPQENVASAHHVFEDSTTHMQTTINEAAYATESKSGDADSSDNQFKCDYCKQVFRRQTCLKRHFARKHKGKVSSTCFRCGKTFQDRLTFKEHCHNTHKDFLCETKGCDFHSESMKAVRTHQALLHNSGFQCRECSYQASSKRALSKHLALKHASFFCPKCPQKFLSQRNLSCHLRVAHSVKSQRDYQRTKLVTEREGNKPDRSGKRNNTTAGFSHKVDKNKEPSHGDSDAGSLGNKDPDQSSPEVSQSEHNVSDDEVKMSQDLIENQSVQAVCRTSNEMHAPQTCGQVDLKGKRKLRKNSMHSKTCPLCGIKSASSAAYFRHLREQHPDTCFPCMQCDKCYSRREGLTVHILSEHDKRVFKCCQCPEVYQTTRQLLRHSTVEHNEQKPFQCEEASCSYKTGSWRAFTSHKDVHITEKNSVCDKCGSCFPVQRYLRLHQRTCLKLEQHLCSVCGEVFALRQSLLSHINNKHGGKRRYSCNQCGRMFSCHGNRMRHMRIHDNTFPYMCDTCGQKFRHSNSLKEHVRIKHKNER